MRVFTVFKTEKRRPSFKIQNDINRFKRRTSRFQGSLQNVKPEIKNLKISFLNHLVQCLIFFFFDVVADIRCFTFQLKQT